MSDAPLDHLWLPAAPAEVAVVDGDRLYIGGGFGHVGPHTGPFGLLDATSGALWGDRPILDGRVNAVEADGAGGWFVGGSFSEADGTPRRRLAHVLLDGSLGALDLPIDGEVFALELHGQVLYVGGHFVAVGGLPRICLAAIDVVTGSVLPWDPTFGFPWNTYEGIQDIVIAGDTLIAGGYFDQTFLGVPRRNLVALDTTSGQATPWAPEPDGWVWSLDLQGSLLFVGGSFSDIGGLTSPRFAIVDTTSGLAQPLALAIDKSVTALAVSGDVAYLGGLFTHVGGQPRRQAAAIQWSTATVLDWAPIVADDDGGGTAVWDLELGPSSIYLAGSFGTINGEPRLCIAEVDLGLGDPTAWTGDAAGRNATSVASIGLQGNSLAVGGDFMTLGGARRMAAACIDLRTGELTGWDPEILEGLGSNAAGSIQAILPVGDQVYLGGKFRMVGQHIQSHLALVDADQGLASLSFSPGPFHPTSDFIRDILLVGERLFVTGFVDWGGGEPRWDPAISRMENIAALDPVTGRPLPGWGCRTGNVYAMASSPDGALLYVGGSFSHIGPDQLTPRSNLAALDVATGMPTPWAPDPDKPVRSLLVDGPRLVVGGEFGTISGQPRRALAVLDRVTGAATPTVLDVTGTGTASVVALAQDGPYLYIGGNFDQVAGVPRGNLSAIDLRIGLPTAWRPDPILSPSSFAYSPSVLVIAGGLDSISHPHLAGFALGW